MHNKPSVNRPDITFFTTNLIDYQLIQYAEKVGQTTIDSSAFNLMSLIGFSVDYFQLRYVNRVVCYG